LSWVVSHLFFPLGNVLTCTRYTRLKYFNLPYHMSLLSSTSWHR
jgi:hypothetical protein